MKIILNESQFKKICEELSREQIDQKANEANINPSDAQVAASNYKMGHVRVKGFEITIENPVGSKRYYGKDRKKFNVMKNHYGYFTKTKGKDGDQVDVFIGPDVDKFEKVYVIDQKINGSFDESKVMLGFLTKKEAKAAYFSNFDGNWHGFMHITGVSIPTFKKWLYRGRRQRQPFANYVEIQKNRLNESVSVSDEPDFLKWKPVVRNSMMNLRNTETGELLSDKWYAWCGHMIDGLAIVMDNDGKYNYLKDNGDILLDEWYDDVTEFKSQQPTTKVRGLDKE